MKIIETTNNKIRFVFTNRNKDRIKAIFDKKSKKGMTLAGITSKFEIIYKNLLCLSPENILKD